MAEFEFRLIHDENTEGYFLADLAVKGRRDNARRLCGLCFFCAKRLVGCRGADTTGKVKLQVKNGTRAIAKMYLTGSPCGIENFL